MGGRGNSLAITTLQFHLCGGDKTLEGEWRFLGNSWSNSRIDHAFHTPHLKVEVLKYINWIRKPHLAGIKAVRAVSDHAVLRSTIPTGQSAVRERRAVGMARLRGHIDEEEP